MFKPKSNLFPFHRLAKEDKTGTFSFPELINLPPSRVTMNYFIGGMNSDEIFELNDALV